MATITAGGIWRETRAVVARHFSTLATLAGATVFLPNAAVRILLPTVSRPQINPADPTTVPPAFWTLLIVVIALQIAGLFAIAAITADRSEGGGRPVRETLAASLPALSKFAGALGLFVIGYFIVAIVLGLVFAIVAGVWLAASPAALAAAQKGEPPAALAGLVLAVVLPLMIYAWARLSPLVGIFLRERTGVIEGIKRAWTLSRGTAGAIMALLAGMVLAWFGLTWVQSGLAGMGLPQLAGVVVDLLGAAAGALIFTYAAAGTGIVYRELSA